MIGGRFVINYLWQNANVSELENRGFVCVCVVAGISFYVCVSQVKNYCWLDMT
jgi:hypothetical protein